MTVTLTVKDANHIMDSYIYQEIADGPPWNGALTYMRCGCTGTSGGTDYYSRAIIYIRLPKLPPNSKIVDMRFKLYRESDGNSGNTKDFYCYSVKGNGTFSERRCGWSKSSAQTGWGGGSGTGGAPDYQCGAPLSIVLNNGSGYQTFQLKDFVNVYQPSSEEGVCLNVWMKEEAADGITDYIQFASIQHANSGMWPTLEIDVDVVAPTGLTIEPNPDDRNQTLLKWEPLNGVSDLTQQKIYRKKASSGVATTDTLIATLASTVSEYIDTLAHDDGADYCYAVFTETSYNSGANAYKSNEVVFQSPGVTGFWVCAVSDSHEGTNIDVQEKVNALMATSGAATRKYIEWGDGGSRWWDPDKLDFPAHYYSTAGLKAPMARAANEAGYWGTLTATTGGHSAPNPQAIKPIARMDIQPTTIEPYEAITVDGTRSYDRQSDGHLEHYHYTASGSKGLIAQPQTSPVATIYYKTTGSKDIKLKVSAHSALDSDEITKSVGVYYPTIQKFSALLETTIEEVTPAKDKNIDEAPFLGTEGSEVITTGSRATKYQLSACCIGTNPESQVRTVEDWFLNNNIVELQIMGDDGAVVEVWRGVLSSFNRQIRGGEPFTKYWSATIIVTKRLYKVTDEAVSYTAGVGTVVKTTIADYDGDGSWIDDVTVNTAAGGGGTDKPVSDVDYPAEVPGAGLRQVTLVDTGFTGTGYTTYWYEVNK